VVKERGRGSTLTELGARLLWAGRRAQSRLAPELDNLAAEFARSVNESLHDRTAALVMQASHDFAVGALRDLAGTEGLDIELQYRGSFEALGALRRGECDVAGFHVADGPLAPLMTRRYAECLPLGISASSRSSSASRASWSFPATPSTSTPSATCAARTCAW
jgi:DNA-binding transcriptional LysR family regulator